MIRLGSLAGYPFEGPRVLVGWTAPTRPAVYAILTRNDPEGRPNDYSVIYVGHADDLSTERFPIRHRHAKSWIERAGSKWNLHICTYEVPGGMRSHREQITRELIAVYHPTCNPEQYDQQWKSEWIGSYSAPTTSALTTPTAPRQAAEAARPIDQEPGR
ncbi:MAG: hypothetical protein ACO3D0_07525 [Ilumatobacteraceae bacterium]